MDDPSGVSGPWIEPRDGPPPEHQYGVRHLMVLVLACALTFAVIAYAGWVVLAFLLTLAPVALIVGLIVVVLSGRRAQQDALLWAVSLAAGRGMPLAPGIEAFADLCRGRFRRRALALAHFVGAGVPLAEAVERAPRVFPRAAVLYARMGWGGDVLARALGDAAAARGAWQPVRHALTLRLLYLAGVVLVLQGIITFVLYFIIPKYEAIFADFGVNLPGITIAVIVGSHWLIRTGTLPILVLLESALLLALLLLLVDWFHWDVPLLDRLARRRHVAAALRALSYGMEAGEPLPATIATLSRRYPSRWIRRRLARVRDDVAAGNDWRASLRRRGFLRRSEAAVLEAAQRVGNLPWALRELADGIERRLRVRLYASGQVLFPLVIVAIGAGVAVLAVAFFVPLLHLIERLAR